jgi:hypothetical protein
VRNNCRLAVVFLSVASIVAGSLWLASQPCVRCVITPSRYHHGPPTAPSWLPTLKILAGTQEDYRANDRDGNGKKEFWRKDVAGLYALQGPDRKPWKLLPLQFALADDHPAGDTSALGLKQPMQGMWYRAILHEGEDPRKPDPQRFAFAAIPSAFPRHQDHVFIIDEYNTIWASDAPYNLDVTVFPKDPFKAGWVKVD